MKYMYGENQSAYFRILNGNSHLEDINKSKDGNI